MPKKSSRRRTANKDKQPVLQNMPSPLPVDSTLPTTQPNERWKIGNLLAIVSLVLSAIGAIAIIELRPQVEVLPMAETENSQPFSAPFRIHNGGYLSFYLKRAFCFESDLKNEMTEKGNGKIANVSTGVGLNRWLGSSHDAAVMCGFHILPRVTNADMTIVVDYSPWGLSRFFTSREHFRSTGVYVDNWQWIEVDPAPTEKEVDDQIRKGDDALKYLDQLHKSKK